MGICKQVGDQRNMETNKKDDAFPIPILAAITSAHIKPDAVRMGIVNALGFTYFLTTVKHHLLFASIFV